MSSDVENTIVPQLLSEIDGVEGLENVIVIGASNREDMTDPAILQPRTSSPSTFSRRCRCTRRPGRARRVGADMRGRHDPARWSGTTSTRTCARTGITYANGDKEERYFKDFNSGAMIENIVARAKKMAIKKFLDTGQGMRVSQLLAACVDEFSENEDLPNTTKPGRLGPGLRQKGERIVYTRTWSWRSTPASP